MSDGDNAIMAQWQELKTLVESIELDVAKNARGVSAAGVRVRKGLRLIKSTCGNLVKLTIETEKATKKKD